MNAFERNYTDDKELVNEINWKQVSTKPKKFEFGERNVRLIRSKAW